MYSVLPPTIAQQLRHNKPVLPAKYEQITLMFCGIKDFSAYCARHANDSQQIVNLLNKVFTKFDEKLHAYPEIYKVETVGDKYMVFTCYLYKVKFHLNNFFFLPIKAVCGLPEKVELHTKYICLFALDIMDSVKELGKMDDGQDYIVLLILLTFVL